MFSSIRSKNFFFSAKGASLYDVMTTDFFLCSFTPRRAQEQRRSGFLISSKLKSEETFPSLTSRKILYLSSKKRSCLPAESVSSRRLLNNDLLFTLYSKPLFSSLIRALPNGLTEQVKKISFPCLSWYVSFQMLLRANS